MRRPPCLRAPRARRLTSSRLFHTLGRTLDERRPTPAIVQPPRRAPQSTMSDNPVTYRADDGVAWVTLNRPAVLNALDTELAATLAEHTERAGAGPGASRPGTIPDGGVLRLARVVGLGRAKELALFNDDVTPDAALAMGLVNWVCAPGEVDATVAGLLQRLRHQAPTANAHIK